MDFTTLARHRSRPVPSPSVPAWSRALADRAVTDLGQLLASLAPKVRPGIWVYAVLPVDTPTPGCAAAIVDEAEGRTVVLPEEDAIALGLSPLFRGRWITLRVHSSLAAVGLTARVATELAAAGIPANVLAGFCHDHLLVPVDRIEDALAVLDSVQRRAMSAVM